MTQAFIRLLGRLSVGRKLLLIYLLDLSAVIYISGILINEKFIAIDFARKEVAGTAYIEALRPGLIDSARHLASDAGTAARIVGHAQVVNDAESRWGAGMQSADTNVAFASALRAVSGAPAADASTVVDAALARGRELVTRLGNQSNLILDPDLDSYYSMSLVVLRYPELLEVLSDIGNGLRKQAPGVAPDTDARTQYLIHEGRLDAVAKAIESDHSEALAAGGTVLASTLAPHRRQLAATIEQFRRMARALMDEGMSATTHAAVLGAQVALIDTLSNAWAATGSELDRLLQLRIAGLYQRMWLHLGTALFLLMVILTIVYFVARQIAMPLKHLSAVTDRVRRTGDHSMRATWHSSDEIGRLVVGFNDMLAQLDRERETQKELAASARAADAQRALVEATPLALVVTSIPGHEVLHANPPAQTWLQDRRSDPWKTGLEPAVRARFFQQLADRDAVDEFEVRWRGSNEPTWAVLSARRVRYQGEDAVLTAFTPINHLKLMERRLELWAKVFEATTEGIVIVDSDRRILTANQAFYRSTGYDLQDVVGEKPDKVLVAPADQPALLDTLWADAAKRGTWQGELRLRRRNGTEYPAWLLASPVKDAQGKLSHCILTSIDITDRKKSEERIQFLAQHDVLTGLPNRSLCIERLRQAAQQAQRSGAQLAVVFIDLDHFKDVNDSLGHHIGDALLRSVARRLVESVRVHDTVSRLGGDEFVIVLNGVADRGEAASIVAQRLLPLLRQPHQVEGVELHVAGSVGISMYPDDGRDIDELMRHADLAMYQTKAEGRNDVRFFATEMTERAQQRRSMEAALRQALERREFELYFQPRVAAATGALIGAEALLRWQRGEQGMVAPSQFIPIAEQTGLIVPIGNWVIEQACRQIAEWTREGQPPLALSINLSIVQLRDDGLVDALRSSLRRYRVPPGVLELELTESTLMSDVESSLQRLQRIRELGVIVSIDDFGTGYSSLNYLNRFPIDKLKIDRSFVHGMLERPAEHAITMAIIGLGHTLGLTVVAEGVETQAEAELLRQAACDELQGFLFGRPLPAREFERWCDAYQSQPA